MKRIGLRLIVAVVAFGFGVAVDQVVISRTAVMPQTNTVEAAVATNKVESQVSTTTDSADDSCHTGTYIPLAPDATHRIVLLDYNLAKFDPTGTYFPLKPLPKEFADVEHFDLTVNQVDGEVWGSGFVQTQIDRKYDFPAAEFMLLTERRVFFVTSERKDNGFAYRFEGEFLANPAAQMDSGRAVVRGTLSKTKNGRTVAECKASFEVKYLGC